MKGPEAFRTISEAADELGVPQHVLRFWETKFSFIRPMKRAGGRRFYRPQDLAMLNGVRILLHEEGYTIKGVQKLHKEQGLKRLLQASPDAVPHESTPAPPPPVAETPFDDAPVLMLQGGTVRSFTTGQQGRLREVLHDLEAAKARLRRLIDEP